ncbi:MAG TPA: hypothetical protein PK493_17615, partial [Pseudomonadota bacterium]|nr:hypothetical protein [Pseudomonadota bacterium]
MPAVELLSCLHRLDLSSHSAVPFGRPGLLLALLGEPGTAHAGLAELLIELKAESLVASHLALSSTNLLSGLV